MYDKLIINLYFRCDKGGRKRILVLCISGRILATLAVFLSYMLEDLVGSSTFHLLVHTFTIAQ